MRLVRERAEIGVDVGNQLVDHDSLKCRVAAKPAETAPSRTPGRTVGGTGNRRNSRRLIRATSRRSRGAALSRTAALVGHAVSHHDNERLAFALRDKIIHD